MIRVLFFLALCLPGLAWGQQPSLPTPLHGCGTMSVTTASQAVTTANITLCPNSPAFPAGPLGVPLRIEVQQNSSVGAYVCWLGGTCTTVGEFTAPGVSNVKGVQFLNIATQPPTIITATGTAVIYVEW